MVVPSPTPTTPSEQWMRTRITVCPSMVAIDRRCGRMVGRSRSRVSTRSMVAAGDVMGAGEAFIGIRYLPLGGMVSNTAFRFEEHTSELQSLLRISYSVFCLHK